MFHELTKHTETDIHFLRHKILQGGIQPSYIQALTAAHIKFLLSKLGILNIFRSFDLWGGINVDNTEHSTSAEQHLTVRSTKSSVSLKLELRRMYIKSCEDIAEMIRLERYNIHSFSCKYFLDCCEMDENKKFIF